MNNNLFFSYLAVIVVVTYLIRAIPFTLFSKKVENIRVKSFLYYIPYTVLSAMTVPAVFHATGSIISGVIGFGVAVLVSLKVKSLIVVALCSCAAVYIAEIILIGGI